MFVLKVSSVSATAAQVSASSKPFAATANRSSGGTRPHQNLPYGKFWRGLQRGVRCQIDHGVRPGARARPSQAQQPKQLQHAMLA